jgi:hypothetical protein
MSNVVDTILWMLYVSALGIGGIFMVFGGLFGVMAVIWLLGFLSGKALRAHLDGDLKKARHHTVSSGAVLAHWAAVINSNE